MIPCHACRGAGTVRDNAEIAQGCRAYRLASGASLRAVAAAMRCSAVFLSDLERGNRRWTEANEAKFRDAVDTFR